jgi:hypothetical protein
MPEKRAEGTGVYPGRKFQDDYLANIKNCRGSYQGSSPISYPTSYFAS